MEIYGIPKIKGTVLKLGQSVVDSLINRPLLNMCLVIYSIRCCFASSSSSSSSSCGGCDGFSKDSLEKYIFNHQHQGTQTEILQITENEQYTNAHDSTTINGLYRQQLSKEQESIMQKDHTYKLQKSASFTSSSASSRHSLGSSTTGTSSSISLRSSPLRNSNTKTFKSDTKVNSYQKWETTVESISYVTTKTVAISEYPANSEEDKYFLEKCHQRSRSTIPGPTSSSNGIDVKVITMNGCHPQTSGTAYKAIKVTQTNFQTNPKTNETKYQKPLFDPNLN
ncbi:hypothetical protein GQX74_004327 [Glossina fuscipes]|nr:hypothetical protein GQX74_004327 [Glossina fuscipes]